MSEDLSLLVENLMYILKKIMANHFDVPTLDVRDRIPDNITHMLARLSDGGSIPTSEKYTLWRIRLWKGSIEE